MIDGVLKDSPRTVVFLAESVDVDGSQAEVENRLSRSGSELLPLVGAATRSGEMMLTTLGPRFGEHPLGVPANVRLGPTWTRDGDIAVAVRWEAAVWESLFPVLDGTLLIVPIDEGRCRLAIEASYRPPLDRLGAFLDRVLLRRVAESTVREFLRRLGATLSASCRSADREPPRT